MRTETAGSSPDPGLLQVQVALDHAQGFVAEAPRASQLQQFFALDADQLAAEEAVVGDLLLADGDLGVLAAEDGLAHAEAGSVEVAEALQLRLVGAAVVLHFVEAVEGRLG